MLCFLRSMQLLAPHFLPTRVCLRQRPLGHPEATTQAMPQVPGARGSRPGPGHCGGALSSHGGCWGTGVHGSHLGLEATATLTSEGLGPRASSLILGFQAHLRRTQLRH